MGDPTRERGEGLQTWIFSPSIFRTACGYDARPPPPFFFTTPLPTLTTGARS